MNPRYYRLITEFHKKSGIPIIVNTSFNIKWEPIIESPTDTIRCFFGKRIGLSYYKWLYSRKGKMKNFVLDQICEIGSFTVLQTMKQQCVEMYSDSVWNWVRVMVLGFLRLLSIQHDNKRIVSLKNRLTDIALKGLHIWQIEK